MSERQHLLRAVAGQHCPVINRTFFTDTKENAKQKLARFHFSRFYCLFSSAAPLLRAQQQSKLVWRNQITKYHRPNPVYFPSLPPHPPPTIMALFSGLMKQLLLQYCSGPDSIAIAIDRETLYGFCLVGLIRDIITTGPATDSLYLINCLIVGN